MSPPANPSWPIGRIPVIDVSPVIAAGTYASKAAVGEEFPVSATVFREGHDRVNATAVLQSPARTELRVPMELGEPLGFDRWHARVRLSEPGRWTLWVEAWDDPWATWLRHAEVKITEQIDLLLLRTELAMLLAEATANAELAGAEEAAFSLTRASAAISTGAAPADWLTGVLTSQVRQALQDHGPRRLLTASPSFPIFCDRRRALFSAWYEFFPRSAGATQNRDGSWQSGTFDSSHEQLERAAAMGFDVVYLPPIHPIGHTFRKGPNNTLTPGAHDPGSPWAIGAKAGGHDALHPDLGDWAAFDRFIAKAQTLGLEVALDFALQASPDHPWLRDHPEWFTTRADGTIAYAENPPKKYQDIYPLNFDNAPESLYAECLRILRVWMDRGVRIFRVDNPHTKPVNFWAWLLREVRQSDPDVIFLSEAFTRPEMVWLLGKIGFQQSYTYFTWRNEKAELTEYASELASKTAAFMRPNFFVNTPDILPAYLQTEHRGAFVVRAVLAATMAPSWGVYSGFELYESTPVRPGSEEYLDSEKYQYRPRDFAGARTRGDSLEPLLTQLNQLRRAHPALQQLRQISFHRTNHPEVVCYSKSDSADTVIDSADTVSDSADTVIVICSLQPDRVITTEVEFDLAAPGLAAAGETWVLQDHLGAAKQRWNSRVTVELTPEQPAMICTLSGPNQ